MQPQDSISAADIMQTTTVSIPRDISMVGIRPKGTHWICKSNYWLSVSKNSVTGHPYPGKCRLSACLFAEACDVSPYCNSDNLLAIKLGTCRRHINLAKAQNGIDLEPQLLEHYNSRFRHHEVVKMGLAFPVWNPRLTCIADAVIRDEGLLEIKTTSHMPESIIQNKEKLEQGVTFSPYYWKLVPEHHYIQMQGMMAIMDRRWCDYFLFNTKSKVHATQAVLARLDKALSDEEVSPDPAPSGLIPDTVTVRTQDGEASHCELRTTHIQYTDGTCALRMLPITDVYPGYPLFELGLRNE